MHLNSDKIEIVINDEADDVIKELFDSLKKIYQNNLESMKGSDSVFDYIYLLYHKCHKINPNRSGSYIDSPDWIKNKKDAATAALHYEEIKKRSAKSNKN